MLRTRRASFYIAVLVLLLTCAEVSSACRYPRFYIIRCTYLVSVSRLWHFAVGALYPWNRRLGIQYHLLLRGALVSRHIPSACAGTGSHTSHMSNKLTHMRASSSYSSRSHKILRHINRAYEAKTLFRMTFYNHLPSSCLTTRKESDVANPKLFHLPDASSQIPAMPRSSPNRIWSIRSRIKSAHQRDRINLNLGWLTSAGTAQKLLRPYR